MGANGQLNAKGQYVEYMYLHVILRHSKTTTASAALKKPPLPLEKSFVNRSPEIATRCLRRVRIQGPDHPAMYHLKVDWMRCLTHDALPALPTYLHTLEYVEYPSLASPNSH